MKGRILIFAGALAYIAFYGAMGATDARDATRRSVSNGTTISTTTSRQKSFNTQNAQTTTRGTTSATTSGVGRATAPRNGAIISDAVRGTTTATTQPRKATTSAQRGATVTARAAAATSRSLAPTRATSATNTAPGRTVRTFARAAATTDPATVTTREQILGRDFNSCRQVYYECMDEFCANKDTQLKRCACSSRLHDFDKTKKQLATVEDKLLDFNQRLLTVSMDKEDAEAISIATEGELAFNKKDTSASKKILDEIKKKLNTDTSTYLSQGASTISWSLDEDAAFDSVDSLMGASTTTKEGVALYNAALPICREMAAEVCSDADMAIAESGYQMTIEQDCNTVAKAYESQTTQAREKVREGGALLDISRLDTYQNKNADDTLACKSKMLDQMYATTVCGTGLSKCLDISGQYIDPSTGQAFLTDNLINLSTLITRPDDGEKWTAAPNNEKFVLYLKSKKKFLEPAMKNCEDIADTVWDEFIEEALAQIKLAQDAKLQEVRESCTKLTAQCLSDATESINDFDSRALSTFGVLADKTVNAMCASVQNACHALIDAKGDTDWYGGMTQIATEQTYDTILKTCREVGRACIIQQCKSVSGNFALCESIDSSIRKSILKGELCKQEVDNCVSGADETAIMRIFQKLSGPEKRPTECPTECYGDQQNTADCALCALRIKIWGNCIKQNTEGNEQNTEENDATKTTNIVIPEDGTETLLSWFAKNTGTADKPNNCKTSDQ